MSRGLRLLTRSGCHLCEEMRHELERLRARFDFRLDVCDVDTDVQLLALYGKRIPVLLRDGGPLCEGRFDAQEVIAYLSAE